MLKKTNKAYTICFSSFVKPVVSSDIDKYLSLASMQTLKGFVPDVDLENNIDLLPIAFNACVVNRANKNDDGIDTEMALAVYKFFIHKPIDVEHDRKNVVGVNLTASFSKFGTDVKLEEADIIGQKFPFNITLGGIVWKIVDNKLAKILEIAADPTSKYYEKVAASWELAFDKFHIVAIKGDSKNFEDGEIISDDAEIDKLKPNLRCFGGSGVLPDGRRCYRKPIDVIPVGIGLTTTPAADVKGIAVEASEVDLNIEDEASLARKSEKSEEKISQSQNLDVNKNSIIMKIKSLKELTDETLKQTNASEVSDFIESEIKTVSNQYSDKIKEKDELIKASKETAETLTKTNSELMKKVEELTNIVSEFKTKEEARAKEETFNNRMTKWDTDYELTNEDRQVLAASIKELGTDTYATFEKSMAVLLKEKNKEFKKAQAAKAAAEKVEAEKKTEKKEEAKASEVVSEVVEKGKEEVKPEVATAATGKTETLADKFKKHFTFENVEVKY
jgi:hypothetical protein